MSFFVLCTSSWPGWRSWALKRKIVLYGEQLEYTCTYELKHRTSFATREEAEKAKHWLEKFNRCIGMKCEIVEGEQQC